MQLNSSQLSILTEIGIPVWELRPDSNDSDKNRESSIVTEISQDNRLHHPQSWIVVVDSVVPNSEEQRLLHAMLKAINVNFDDVAVVTRAEFACSDFVPETNKLMLVFGKFEGSLEAGEQSNRQVPQEKIATIFSLGLDELLNNPAKKALVWQHLTSAKQQYEQLVKN